MAVFQEDVVAAVPHLRAFARSLTRGDIAFADDLVQDTMVNALRAQHQFEEGTNLKSWLFTILRNRFRSIVTRRRYRAEVSDDGLESTWSVPAFQESHVELRAFKQAFAALSDAHREVLVLVGINGVSYEEAAEICSCEVGTIKSRVSRARDILKRALLEGPIKVKAKPEQRPRMNVPRSNVRSAHPEKTGRANAPSGAWVGLN